MKQDNKFSDPQFPHGVHNTDSNYINIIKKRFEEDGHFDAHTMRVLLREVDDLRKHISILMDSVKVDRREISLTDLSTMI